MKRIRGITYLKAFLPLMVIACHARPFGQSASMSLPLQGIPDWKDVFYSNILSLAVPLFFVISFYLYLCKRDRIDYPSVKLLGKRVGYFLLLFIIWRIIFIPFGIGNLWISDRGIIRNLYHWIFGGGDTLLYYLEQSAFLLILLEVLCLLSERFNISKTVIAVVGLAITSSIMLACMYVVPQSVKIESLIYFSPIGFVPYIFIALLFKEQKISSLVGCIFILIGIGWAFIEWLTLPNELFLQNGYSMALPFYQKISIVFITFGLFSLVLKVRKKPTAFTERLAAVSLYVYCIHQIIIVLSGRILGDILVGYDFVWYLIVVVLSCVLSFGALFIKSKMKNKLLKVNLEE